ncbi:transporter substrate-binding domain-containing protein [Paroceanicella profunda]|uniref:Transporter substrate-binding domain-containing protein n=1 Tax=Paroceanicella profunda TaxID=2579971 RepID=A0A5B8FX30_9RHOB|nr:lysine/arginine/ornithine ABC transporter substrate-binding protein [Paroceanicella profunda]QDL93105.1 transporter substrate-binding domain-containing protein [Paroceanicella profunda]
MHRLIAGAVAALALSGAASAADLKICVEGAYAPFSETAPDGSVVGFDIDIANALCSKIGKSCEMVKTDWDGIIPALLEKKCDAIVASMSITEDRKQVIDFTKKYYNTPARFVAREGTEMTDTSEGLKGKLVGVQRGTIHQAFMEGEFPDVNLVLYASQDEAYLDLVSGRIDAVIADSIAEDEGFLKTDAGKGYAFFGQPYSIPKYHGDGAGIGVRKEDTELRDQLSAAIDAIRASGEYKTIEEKYFDFDIYGD